MLPWWVYRVGGREKLRNSGSKKTFVGHGHLPFKIRFGFWGGWPIPAAPHAVHLTGEYEHSVRCGIQCRLRASFCSEIKFLSKTAQMRAYWSFG